jgi:hypothetical protein
MLPRPRVTRQRVIAQVLIDLRVSAFASVIASLSATAYVIHW